MGDFNDGCHAKPCRSSRSTGRQQGWSHRHCLVRRLFDFPSLAPASAVSKERRELVCSVIGLTVKCSLALLAGVSLLRLAGAYQERMDRQGELAAVLDLEQAKLARARDRFDRLFGTDGEQRLIREQNQWIAPNRLRVVWDKADDPAFPTVASQR